jgi:hypothetical protein
MEAPHGHGGHGLQQKSEPGRYRPPSSTPSSDESDPDVVCMTCWTPQPKEEFPSPTRLPQCAAKHPMRTCWECLDSHIGTRLNVEDGYSAKANILGRRIAAGGIRCPEVLCHHKFSYEQVRYLVPPRRFGQYDQLLFFSALDNVPGFRWCGSCEAGYIYQLLESTDSGGDNGSTGNTDQPCKISCGNCHFEACSKCQMPWHEGKDCDTNDAATQTLLAEISKCCPECQAQVTREDGCSHILCQLCGHQFCWDCLAPWDPKDSDGGNAHKPDCARTWV